jgi:hypothetical protein
VTAPHASPFHFGKRPPEMKSRKEEHPDECNYETVKKETGYDLECELIML